MNTCSNLPKSKNFNKNSSFEIYIQSSPKKKIAHYRFCAKPPELNYRINDECIAGKLFLAFGNFILFHSIGFDSNFIFPANSSSLAVAEHGKNKIISYYSKKFRRVGLLCAPAPQSKVPIQLQKLLLLFCRSWIVLSSRSIFMCGSEFGLRICG